MTGKIGPYEIRERLGRGGMGEVFSAHDSRLDRIVALKTISPELLHDGRARQRFLTEARAAAALTHPFICTVHEVLEHDGQPVIVMEHVEGETLRSRIAAGPLSPDEVCRIGAEIAEALAAAHQRGIIHRDVSAANIMLTASGHAKVMDFGLAHLAAVAAGADAPTLAPDAMTAPGTLLGTPAYLAPEILRGRRADARTDLYSLGVVLYQIATGRLPFTGGTAATIIADILTRIPAAPRSVRPEVRPALDRVIVRLLAKDPDARYANALDVAADLRAAATAARDSAGRARSIAVLPFKDLAPDAANVHIGVGLADATITELTAIKALLVRPTAVMMRYLDRSVDPLDAGRELGVDAVVDASFQRSGTRLRVTVQLLDMADGRSLWASKITTSLHDLFEMQDEVSRQIARALEIELTEHDRSRLARSARSGGAAYELYLKGRLHLMRETLEDYNQAIELFERARAADPDFAPAYAGLASAYLYMAFTWDPENDWYQRGRHMVDEALRLDPNMPEARFVRGRLLWCPDGRFKHAEALKEFAAALAARPGLGEAHDWMGILLFHISMLDESVGHFERALALNQEDEIAQVHLGYCRYLQGAFQSSLDISNQARHRVPSAWTSYQVAQAEIQLGRLEDAERTIDVAARQFPGHVLFHPLRGLTAALRGDGDAALEHVEATVRNSKAFGHYHHAQYDIACIHAVLGRGDEAVRWLTDAARNGFPCGVFFDCDPLLASVRSNPRFVALLSEIRAECDGYRDLYRALKTLDSSARGPTPARGRP